MALLMIHEALIIAHKLSEFRDIWLVSKAVLFMGTPHRGSSFASFGTTLGNVANLASRMSGTHRFTGGINTHLIETLAQDSGELYGVSADFLLIVKDSALHIISLYETEAHPLTKRLVCTITFVDEQRSRVHGKRTDQIAQIRSWRSLQHSWSCPLRGTFHCMSTTRISVDSPDHRMKITPRSPNSSNLRLPRSRSKERQWLLVFVPIAVSDILWCLSLLN